jgi:hypothetical protein
MMLPSTGARSYGSLRRQERHGPHTPRGDAKSWAEVSNRALAKRAARLDHLKRRVDLMSSVRLKPE